MTTSPSDLGPRNIFPLLGEDRQGLQEITYTECSELLRSENLGRVGFVLAEELVILPVNYAFIAESIVFRTAEGSMLRAAEAGTAMSFEIDGWDRVAKSGWSVLVKGVSEHVTDDWLGDMYDYLGAEPWADRVPREEWIRIRSRQITGRRIVRAD